MAPSGQIATDSWRIILLALLFMGGLVFLGASLYKVQVVRTATLSDDLQRQSIRRVQEPGARGRIFDRHGLCLADNRASHCIVYYLEELRQRGRWLNTMQAVDRDVERLALELGVPRQISFATISNHVLQSLPMPLIAWRDIDEQVMARWAEVVEPFPGVDIYTQPERVYPQGNLAAHVLGYVGRDRPQPLPGQKIHFYLPEMLGKSGIERQYNERLTGACGGRLIRVDARGYKHRTWEGEPSVAGTDIHLTLDATIQRAVEETLRGELGAAVVLDPRNGEVLALTSAPSFDPNQFVPVMRAGVWRRLNDDPRLPLFNRAIQGRYAPGSTFKPVTAMAALRSGIRPDLTYDCRGYFELGNMRLRCWNTYGHGEVGLRRALEQSCNAYFCHLAQTIGYAPLYAEAARLGLGRSLGIDLPGESGALLPSEEWKQQRLKDRWRVGDTCQLAIGQGLLLTTPLQMASLCAAFANGGKLYRPHLLKGEEPEVISELNWSERQLEVVRGGMLDVAQLGTGRRVQLRGTPVAAKTGTAELDVRGVRRKNTWVIAFAPFDKPRVAIAMLVENGESGGFTVAPLVQRVLKAIFGETPEDESSVDVKAIDDSSVRGD